MELRNVFAEDFIFGVATSAYQIEGAQFGGAGECIWDYFCRNGGTVDGHSGAIACDHYHRYQEDFDLVRAGGFDAYRFSFSWARLFPDGREINREGVAFYHRLIDAMLSRGLRPFATAYHWDMPQALAQAGGWTQRDNAMKFAEYMGFLAREFGDKIESLSSINEPWCVSWLSYYLGEHAPGLKDISAAAKASHNILLAHGLGVASAKSHMKRPLGIVLNFTPSIAADNSDNTREARAAYEAITNQWCLEAIFKRNYPDAALSALEQYMPSDWQNDMEIISQAIDFLGVNYYTSVMVAAKNDCFPYVEIVERGIPKTDMGWEIDPQSFGDVLDFVATYSKELPIYITENGMASAKGTNDVDRIDYLKSHLKVLEQKAKSLPIKGYFNWSLLDNFEWAHGFHKRFGLVSVDYKTQKRTPKASYYWWQRKLRNE